MITWRYAPLDEACGGCARTILAGELQLLIQLKLGPRVRCKSCGSRFLNEAPPASLPDDPNADREPTPTLLSLSATPTSAGFVSTGDLARRRAAKHFQQRGRR